MIKYFCDLCQKETEESNIVKIRINKLICITSLDNPFYNKEEKIEICNGFFSVLEDTMSKLRIE